MLGANGFIGREVSRLFIEHNEHLLLYSRRAGKINDYRVKGIDISKKGILWKHLSGRRIKAIVYLAAKIPSSISSSTKSIFFYNLKLHKEVLSCWLRLKCQLIYVSSASVYGRAPSPWVETKMPQPDNYYSFSKAIGELMFRLNSIQRGLPLTILRINAPFGVNPRHKTVVNVFIEQSLRGGDISIFGSGRRQQDFIHVSEIARAVWLSYKKKKAGLYNIASGNAISMLQLAELIKKLCKSKSRMIKSRMIKNVRVDPEEKKTLKIDISRANKDLDFHPSQSLKEGLKRCIQQYRKNIYENRHNS